MCGIYFSNENETVANDSKFLNRGPDYFNKFSSDNITMCHSLLSLTGDFTPQPVTKNGVSLIFNGQIYNYDSSKYKSDSYFLLDQYLEFDLDFWNNLDGEYAVVIYDSRKKNVIFATDIFGTKPLFYSLNKNSVAISSLYSSLKKNKHQNIKKCKPNTIYSFGLENFKFSIIEEYYKFNLDQHKETFNDWNKLFIESIHKRFSNLSHDIILPLSSGHDSGAIACALDQLGIKYYSYSFFRQEHVKVLTKRLIKRFLKSPLKTRFRGDLQNDKTRIRLFKYLKDNTDPFFYGPDFDNLKIDGQKDPGSIGLTYVLEKSIKMNHNIKIVASGQGGDEIYTRRQQYSFGNPNPAYFDNNLKNIFPWQNFYYGTQISYLAKEESVGGSFGLETRYPYLDKKLVQEYLNLMPDLKNKYYKSPLTNFLYENNYPYRHDDRKSGFNP